MADVAPAGLMIVPVISPVFKSMGIVSRIRKAGGNSSCFVVAWANGKSQRCPILDLAMEFQIT